MQTVITYIKKIVLSLIILFSSAVISMAQDSVAAPEVTQKPLAKAPFESGICMDNQTVSIPPSKTLEFVLQHRFGTIQNGWSDLAGLWGASNIRIGLNFSITKNLLVGLGTTKTNRLQDLQVKYTFLHQRKGGFPLTIAYFGNLSLNAMDKVNFGTGYKFVDRFAFYHEFLFARRFCNMFSLQLGVSYTHFNKVDKTVDSTAKNDAIALALLARIKVSPQSSIVLSYQQPIILNYDPAFVVRYPNKWMEIPKKAPYPNISLGWEISTSTHTFHIYLSAAQGILPSEIVMHNTNNFFNGFILVGFNLTRLWSL
ncbi:MAG: DUF5777 family beta-barrel protein [Bacteroidales bacterium]|jgi:hypothetical protein|nr:DUF5777 family beta-barrel protein [Bacteroidales bacterium]